ncbi:hypothetical protein [Pseudophaeobacter arcticus]|jgi:hypothetical protein|uniref:hypothetical protein n=1 Tax=Pseudophaeobacter arcticus TaxID=385492 RepID=UPI0039E52B6C
MFRASCSNPQICPTGADVRQHSGNTTDETKSNPAKVFETGNEAAPYNDLFNHARSVPLAFFATLETVKDRGGYTQAEVGYRAWDKYILQMAAKRKLPFEGVKAILQDDSKRTNATQDLTALLEDLPKLKHTPKEMWGRATEVLRSLRLNGVGAGNENTILTADQAWRAVKLKARAQG